MTEDIICANNEILMKKLAKQAFLDELASLEVTMSQFCHCDCQHRIFSSCANFVALHLKKLYFSVVLYKQNYNYDAKNACFASFFIKKQIVGTNYALYCESYLSQFAYFWMLFL